MNIKNLIDRLDNDPGIYQLRFGEVLVWPLFRFKILQTIIDAENELNVPHTSVSKGPFNKFASIVRTINMVPVLAGKNPILFMNSALSNVKSNEDGKYFNRVCDHFFLIVRYSAWMIEESYNFQHPSPRKYHKVYSRLPFSLYAEVIARLIFKFNKNARREAELCGLRLEELVIHHLTEAGLVKCKIKVNNLAASFSRPLLRSRPLFNLYRHLFSQKKVKTLIIEDGHYGGDNSLVIAAAHSLQIKVLEPQHGFINANHPVYNFGSKLCLDKEMQNCFPDILMTYGKFWSLGAKIPGRVCEIGNPNLELSANTVVTRQKKILVLGSGVAVTEMQQLLDHLITLNKEGYDIYYRPHPQEKSGHVIRYGTQYEKGILVDDKQLYLSMAESEIVIGELTTALFESVLFCKKVFLFKSRYTNTYYQSEIKFFNEFDLDTVSVVFSNQAIDAVAAKKYYWTDGFKARFEQIIFE